AGRLHEEVVMENIWVVVADSGRARLFRAENITSPLQEARDLVNPDSRLAQRELLTDGPGRAIATGGNHEQRSEKDHQARRFAGEVIDEVERLRARGELERMHVIAAPEFLGRLREHYPPPLRKCVVEKVASR